MNNNRAIYAGSFDPPTNGHLWMIKEACNLFDEVIVAIGVNPDKKKYIYDEHERKFMLTEITKNFGNIKIDVLGKQFVVDFAKKVLAKYLIRGIRSVSDYEFEKTIRYINSDLYPKLSTIFLIPPRKYGEISSTIINGMVGVDGWQTVIKSYIPIEVYNFIINKYK